MADTDPYGFFSDEPPRKKRVRTKRLPEARDVEAPSAPATDGEADADDADPYGFFADDEPDDAPDLTRGAPPGPAGAKEPERTLRTEEPAWYEPLLSGYLSMAQGGYLNSLDEVTAATTAATDWAGLTESGNSYDENRAVAEKALNRATHDYPAAHQAGQVGTGMAASMIAPGTKAAQAATGAATSAIGEYAESGDVLKTLGAGALGGAAGFLGGWGAQKAAKLGAVDKETALLREFDEIAKGRPAMADDGLRLPRASSPPPVPPPSPGARTNPTPYDLGELDLTLPAALPGPGIPAAPQRELRDLALKRGAENVPKSGLGELLGLGSNLAGRSPAGVLLRGAGAANKLRSPTGLDLAIKAGEMVPSQPASEAARVGVRGAYDLSGVEDYALSKGQKVAPAVNGLLGSADSLLTSKAYAQDADHVAYADAPTFNYAVSEVLHAGSTGLPPADEQALTSAVVSGDDRQIAATSFRLRQRYPAYARQVEKSLRGLNEEE